MDDNIASYLVIVMDNMTSNINARGNKNEVNEFEWVMMWTLCMSRDDDSGLHKYRLYR